MRQWWDDGCILYHIPSGDTHHLSPLAAEAFEQLEQASFSIDTLSQCLAATLDIGLEDSFREQIREMIQRFDELGLVKAVEP